MPGYVESLQKAAEHHNMAAHHSLIAVTQFQQGNVALAAQHALQAHAQALHAQFHTHEAHKAHALPDND